MTDTSPAVLRAAATRLRELATADGITPGPWLSLDHGDRLLYDGPGAEDQPPVYVVDEPMSNGANADYIEAMHPGVGLALAAWLDTAAAGWEDLDLAAATVLDGKPEHAESARLLRAGPYDSTQALAVARLILGQEAPAEPNPPACEGFVWIGQPFTTCDRCGRPAWEHAALEVAPPGAGPFDHARELRPWAPGETDKIRAKWEAPDA